MEKDMTARILNLKRILNKNVQSIMPMDEQKEHFIEALDEFIARLHNNAERDEEFQKDVFRDFLQKVLPNKFINTSGKIDMAIYNGRKSESKPGVIIEYKKILNTPEMMSTANLNAKSFRELVSYYLHERLVNNNLEVKKGIVTNGYNFFVFNSDQLEKYKVRQIARNNLNKSIGAD